jgi:integrase
MKRHKAARGRMDLPADEIRKLIDAADVHLRAMIYLGANAAFGNHDCGMLPQSAVNLETGWVEFPRPKTGEPRRAKLWPETIKALKASLAKRPTPKNVADADLFFVTKYGNGWGKEEAGNAPICQKFRKLLLAAELHRPGLGFYSLRRTFRTIAGQTLDEMAVDMVMGHGAADGDMGKRYTQFIGDDRLERVAEHVRAWLFAKPARSRKGV